MNDNEQQEQQTSLEALRSILEDDPRRIVLVVGSGVTRGAVEGQLDTQAASWSGLIEHGLGRAASRNLIEDGEQESLLASAGSGTPDMMIAAADRVVSALGGRDAGEYGQWLETAFQAVDVRASRTGTIDAIAAMSALGVRIATTNYDGVLERFLGLETVVWTDSAAAEDVLAGRRNGVLHLHGHWRTPRSVVFGKADYDALLEGPGSSALLNAVRTLKTMVFVGTGAGLLDPNFGRLRDWAGEALRSSSNAHYWMVRAGEERSIPPETLRDERTTPLLYDEHDELPGMLRRLLPPTPKSSVPPEVSARGVLLLLNVRVRETWQHLDVRDVRRHAGVAIAAEDIVEVRMDGDDLEVVDPRWWDRVAGRVRDAVAEAQEREQGSVGAVEFVIAGHAPLSVFAYAGHVSFRRLVGPIRFVNLAMDSSGWDVIVSGAADGSHVEYSVDPAQSEFLQRSVPRHAVYANASRPERCAVDRFASLKGARESEKAAAIAGLSNILARHRPNAQVFDGAAAVGAEDIRALRLEICGELRRLHTELKQSRGVLGYYGPGWGAFEIGRSLKPGVHGNIDVPHFLGETQGYSPAMTLSGSRESILFRRPRFLFLAAEPIADSRVGGAATLSAAVNTLRDAGVPPEDVHFEGATRISTMHNLLGMHNPHVVQLLLHGAGDGTVGLVGPTDRPRLAALDEVLEAFRRSAVRPALVVLTVCNSMVLGDRLLDVADHVVVSGEKLATPNAGAFTRHFFALLAEGNSIWDAFETAKREEVSGCPPAALRLLSNPAAASPKRVFFHRA